RRRRDARQRKPRRPGGRRPAARGAGRRHGGVGEPIERRRRRRRALMKVAIAGAGNVGLYIATDLQQAGHDVLLIEENPDLVARLKPTVNVNWYTGDACEVSNLHEAGISDADVMVAATGDDEDNLVVSLLAKQEFAVPRVIARV